MKEEAIRAPSSVHSQHFAILKGLIEAKSHSLSRLSTMLLGVVEQNGCTDASLPNKSDFLNISKHVNFRSLKFVPRILVRDLTARMLSHMAYLKAILSYAN